jgi:hypothetical protein
VETAGNIKVFTVEIVFTKKRLVLDGMLRGTVSIVRVKEGGAL